MAGAQIAPLEPGPHSHSIPKSEWVSVYGKHAILDLDLDKGSTRPSRRGICILNLILEAANSGQCMLQLDEATVTAEPLSELCLEGASSGV